MEDTILCPDCRLEIITQKQYEKHQRCTKCSKRKYQIERRGDTYIPFINLSKKEQKQILARREGKFKEHTKNKKSKKSINFTENMLQEVHELRLQQVIFPKIKQMLKDKYNITASISTVQKAYYRYLEKIKLNNTKMCNKVNPIIKRTIINKDNTDNITLNNDGTAVTSTLHPDIIELKGNDVTLTGISLEQEVEKVSKEKFKELKCKELEDYTTNTYIDMLNLLQFLVVNRQQIIETRQKQHDVMNAYQDDVLHEIEKTEPVIGDNTLQTKLHIIRDKRRYYEYDFNDVSIMKQFLESIDLKKLNIVLGQLKKFKETRENPTFIPSVDKNMTTKYNWTINVQKSPELKTTKIPSTISEIKNINNTVNGKIVQEDIPEKFKQSFKSPQEFFQLEEKVTKSVKNMSKYRVTCNLSGGGYRSF